HVARGYGKLPLAVSLAPAIRLARDGFKVDPRFARIAQIRERFLQSYPDAARVFLDGRRAPQPGYLLRQPELAATLERLGAAGAAGFYGGAAARALVDARNRHGGVWAPPGPAHRQGVRRTPVPLPLPGA